MEAIKIDPTAKYVLFVRDAPPEWVTMVEKTLREWIDSPSRIIMVNIPGQGRVYLEKLHQVSVSKQHSCEEKA